MCCNNLPKSYVRHAIGHPLHEAGLVQSLVAQTRHPHRVFHGQRRQYVHEHQRAQLFKVCGFHFRSKTEYFFSTSQGLPLWDGNRLLRHIGHMKLGYKLIDRGHKI